MTQAINGRNNTTMKTTTMLAAFSLALAATSWAQDDASSKDDSFAKYGQEFKGRIQAANAIGGGAVKMSFGVA